MLTILFLFIQQHMTQLSIPFQCKSMADGSQVLVVSQDIVCDSGWQSCIQQTCQADSYLGRVLRAAKEDRKGHAALSEEGSTSFSQEKLKNV